MKYLLFIFLLSFLNTIRAQELIALQPTNVIYSNEQQLRELYIKYGQTLLIISDNIYLIPCDCSPCRNAGGNGENRNAGGDNSDRLLGGGAESRSASGENQERMLGGNGSDRNVGGNTNDRNVGNAGQERRLGGDADGRNSKGENQERQLGGDANIRNAAGVNQNRQIGGNADGRNSAGAFKEFACSDFSKSKIKFYNINFNATILYYDGDSLRSLDDKGIVKK